MGGPVESPQKNDYQGAEPTTVGPESVYTGPRFEVITGSSNPELARAVGGRLWQEVWSVATPFPDGETGVQIQPNLRRKDVYIIQSTSQPANEHIMELIFMIRAAKRASANEITAVIPYYGYARQDRKDKPRVTISGADVADMLAAAGAKRIFTIDLHAEQMEGAFSGPWDNLYGSRVLLPEIRELGTENMVVVAPDVGAAKRAENMSVLLESDEEIAIIRKRRTGPGVSRAVSVIGDVEGKDALLVDDMIAGGGTIADAARLLKENGAERIYAAATHGLFLGDALDKIEASPIEKIFVTDTVRHRDEVRNDPRITVVTVADMLADAIVRMDTGGSLSELIPSRKKQ